VVTPGQHAGDRLHLADPAMRDSGQKSHVSVEGCEVVNGEV
jgi:hypothetical protein